MNALAFLLEGCREFAVHDHLGPFRNLPLAIQPVAIQRESMTVWGIMSPFGPW